VRKTTGAELCMWNGGRRCEQKLIGLMGLFYVVTQTGVFLLRYCLTHVLHIQEGKT